MSDQTPDLAALEALAEAATPGPWRQAPWHMVNVMPKAWAEDVQPIEDRGPFMCITTSGGSSDMAANRREAEVLAAYVAAADPQTVLWLIREVERLRESIAGSPDKAQRLASLVASSTRLVQIERDDARTRAEKAEATIERVRELADSWIGSRSDLGPVTRACGALLRAALDGGESDARD